MQKNALYKLQFFLITLLFSSLFLSCSGEIESKIRFSLPDLPENITSAIKTDYWQITFSQGQDIETFIISRDSKYFTLQLSDYYPAAVLAQPFTKNTAFFKPAGIIYPYEKNLSWISGFEADTLLKLYSNNFPSNNSTVKNFASRFNWKKFSETIQIQCLNEGNSYNPWNLNQEEILSSISNHTFTARKLNQKKCPNISREDILSNQEDILLFYNFIPLNEKSISENSYPISSNHINEFLLYRGEKFQILTISINTDESFSLAINSLPL